MMGIDEFLNFEKALTALVKECGIDKYLKMRDERVAYGICQYLQNLWDIMHDRDEWHIFLARMENPKPAETAAFTRKQTVIEPGWKNDSDHCAGGEPIQAADPSSILCETLRTPQGSKSGFVDENETSVHDEHIAQVEDELEQKFLDMEKRYVKLLGVVESLQAAKHTPEKDHSEPAFIENPVPAIQVLDQEPEIESFPPLMGFPEEEPEENSIPTFHYLDPTPEEESVPLIHFADQAPVEDSVPVINFPDPAPEEESVPLIHFADQASVEDSVPTIHFPDSMPAEEADPVINLPHTMPGEGSVPVINFPDPMPEEESVPTIHFPDPMPEEESVPTIDFPDLMPGEGSVPVINFPDPMPEEDSVPTIHFPDPMPEEEAVPVIQFRDSTPVEDSVPTKSLHEIPFNVETETAPEGSVPAKGFHEIPFNMESETAPEDSVPTNGFHEIPFNTEPETAPEAVPTPEQEPSTEFALETNSFNTSAASDPGNLREKCQRIGHPEAGFHISCFKCDKQKECQNSHDNQRSKR